MTVQTAVMVALVAGLGTAQYIFTVQALRDLRRRPRVRGDNKTGWTLLILCLPIVGALVYGWMGPTSLIRRPNPSESTSRPYPIGRPAPRRNITPISEARRRERPVSASSERGTIKRFRRTGS
ncbi:MAG TPA: PLDc N-terminal domain-containing protein [Thermomicrobiales bacterium]|nr:PLDc N-terminal domain-containing protein [Thermomicrobiales bacterium]